MDEARIIIEQAEVDPSGKIRRPTQRQRIREYVAQFGSITPLEAMRDLGIMRLAARIEEMEKEDGDVFIHKKVRDRNRLGQQISYMKYIRVSK